MQARMVLFILVLMLAVDRQQAASPVPGRIPYYILEGLAPQTPIGNVAIDSGLTNKYDENIRQQLRYTFLKQVFYDHASANQSHLFAIDEESGVMKTASEIDRDVICARQIRCLVLLDVAVGPPEYFDVINAVVDILDVNDHAPIFPEKEIYKKVSEATVAGSSFTIPTAVDPDSKAYSVQMYELVSGSNKFELVASERDDGSSDLRLFIKEKLDREEADYYQFKVVAHDGGTPSKSGSVLINIEVEDYNDNDPAFDNSTYEVYVMENSDVGTTIGNVRALDKDLGTNGEVTYGFSRQTANSYGDMFGIEASSGAIYLKQSLDFERGSTYLLTVMADDGGSDTQAGQATVVVRVEDANDNLPIISINTLTANGVAKIPETADIGMFVAHVYASDMDGGNNGKLECDVQGVTFELQQRSQGQYDLVTAARLDYETHSHYDIRITCSDVGTEPQSSVAVVKMDVVDSNDHAPVFSKQVYMESLRENNFVNQRVLDVNATDADQGQNGQVRYKLHSDAKNLFKIHTMTGLITTNAVFDREKTEQLSFHVVAYDLGTPALDSTATVLLTILDANDEAPVFSQRIFTFGFYENEPINSEVGQVMASDADSAGNNNFQYAFATPAGDAGQSFKIDPNTGTIYSRKTLDREEKAAYYMTVIASSEQFPPMTSTASVTIYIADQNDHRPVITWPMPYNKTVQMSSELPVGHPIATIEAQDSDIGGNGQLVYSIVSQQQGDYFTIDPTLGTVTLQVKLDQPSQELYRLTIQVADSGFPVLTDQAQLNIIVNKSIPFDPPPRVIHRNNNTTIIISLTSASLLLIFLLIIAVVLFRRQNQDKKKPAIYEHRAQTVIRTESQKMLHLMEERDKEAPDGREAPVFTQTPTTFVKDKNISCVVNLTDSPTGPQSPVTDGQRVTSPSCSNHRYDNRGHMTHRLQEDDKGSPVWKASTVYLKTAEAENAHNMMRASQA